MNKCCFVLFVFLNSIALNVLGQQNWQFGAQANYKTAFSNLYFSGSNAFNSKSHLAIPSFEIGPTFQYNINRKWVLKSGLDYAFMQFDNSFKRGLDSSINIVNAFHLLKIPLAISCNFTSKWSADLGFAFQYNLYSKQKNNVHFGTAINNFTVYKTKTIAKQLSLPMFLKANYSINNHWLIFSSYEILFDGYLKQPNYNNQYFKNAHAFAIGLAYDF